MANLYACLLRPAGFATLPRDIAWSYVEAPHDLVGALPHLPRSSFRHGVIATQRELTPNEVYRFDLRAVAACTTESENRK